MMMNIQYHNQRCVHYVLIVTQWFIEKKVLDVEELKKNYCCPIKLSLAHIRA